MRLRHVTGWLVLGVLAWVLAGPVLAQDTTYQATVPVADTSSAERGHAFAVALDHVLARVAGHPVDITAIQADAATYVQEYQYQRAPADASAPFLLTVDFAPSSIRHLLDRLSAANPPAVADGSAVAAASVVSGNQKGTVWISNLHSALDFAGALAALRTTPGVDAVAVQQADNGGMLLEVRTSTPLAQVLDGVEGGGRLAASDAPHAGATASLRWVK